LYACCEQGEKTILRWPMLAGIALAMLARVACAHDIPNDVKVQAFVKPEGRSLQLLVRVPMSAMREADVPVRGPGYLDLPNADAPLRTAVRLWLVDNIEVYEGDDRLPPPRIADVRVALASDTSFTSYEKALAGVRSPPLPADLDLYWKQQYLDVLLEYPIASERSDFSIHPRFSRLGLQVLTTIRFLPPGGAERAFEIHGDGELVRLDPRWHQAALRFVELGFRHILDGTDHLLFIACLVIPFRRLKPLIVIATAFTVAHSITLITQVLHPGWISTRWVEPAIAFSVAYVGFENLIPRRPRGRWLLVFGFGLVHGLGFASVLREIGLPRRGLVLSLVSFNLGVELGQLLVVGLALPIIAAAAGRAPRAFERWGLRLGSGVIAAFGTIWLIARLAAR
jgi:hypothetical protein